MSRAFSLIIWFPVIIVGIQGTVSDCACSRSLEQYFYSFANLNFLFVKKWRYIQYWKNTLSPVQ